MAEKEVDNLGYFCIFFLKKPKGINHPRGENSPNLVTLSVFEPLGNLALKINSAFFGSERFFIWRPRFPPINRVTD
jgi:hypothetical protein